MSSTLQAKFLDLAHTGFDFLNNDLDAGLILARIAAEATASTIGGVGTVKPLLEYFKASSSSPAN